MNRVSIDEKWCRDTGIVAAILLLFFGRSNVIFILVSIVVLVLVLFSPRALWPLGFVWKVVAEALAAIVPRIFFGLVFVVIILPLGLLRRVLGSDPLMLAGERYGSAFKKRNHTFSKQDLIMPF